MEPPDSKLMTVKQVADCLDRSDQTIRRWIERGVFPNAVKGPGKTDPYFIPLEDVEAFLESTPLGNMVGRLPTDSARVMVIEDDPDASEIFKVILEDMGLKAMSIHSGSSALTWIEAVHPDIVILDLGLPGVSGRTVLRHIRRSPQLEDVPVIVITANIGNAELMEGVEEMADLILVKPVYYEELQAQVTRLLRRSIA